MSRSSITWRVEHDNRLDPRCRQFLRLAPPPPRMSDVNTRQTALHALNSDAAQRAKAQRLQYGLLSDTEQVAPSKGLLVNTFSFESEGYQVPAYYTRPQEERELPGVLLLHGGGMMFGSCFDGRYRAFARLVASEDVCVVAVDFRNSLQPYRDTDQVAEFPQGLHDCLNGLLWVHDHAEELGIDINRVIVCGDSGGGNLAIALALLLMQKQSIHLISGVFALCPYLAGRWPQVRYPSSFKNNGYVIDLHSDLGHVGYSKDAFDNGDILAWPGLCRVKDLSGFPRVYISVNECDPLRDEGIEFYRKCLAAGVPAQCREMKGMFHCAEMNPLVVPEVSREIALMIGMFARSGRQSRM